MKIHEFLVLLVWVVFRGEALDDVSGEVAPGHD